MLFSYKVPVFVILFHPASNSYTPLPFSLYLFVGDKNTKTTGHDLETVNNVAKLGVKNLIYLFFWCCSQTKYKQSNKAL